MHGRQLWDSSKAALAVSSLMAVRLSEGGRGGGTPAAPLDQAVWQECNLRVDMRDSMTGQGGPASGLSLSCLSSQAVGRFATTA